MSLLRSESGARLSVDSVYILILTGLCTIEFGWTVGRDCWRVKIILHRIISVVRSSFIHSITEVDTSHDEELRSISLSVRQTRSRALAARDHVIDDRSAFTLGYWSRGGRSEW